MFKLRDVSIKYSYMIILALIIIPIMIAHYTFTYKSIKDGIIRNSQIAVEQSKKIILDSIQITEKNYELVSSYYDGLMKESLGDFQKAYESSGGDISSIELQRIKEKYGGVIDLYVIDREGVIVRSTFPEALGIDFKGFPKFYNQLGKIRLADEIEISRVTSELRTNELRKWGYAPTFDHEYVLEVGVASEEIEKYIKRLDYEEISNELKRQNPFIGEINVYDRNNMELVKGVDEKDLEKLEIIGRVFKDEKDFRMYSTQGIAQMEYIFVDTFKSKVLDDHKKIIEITYDYSILNAELYEMKKSATLMMLVYTCASLVLVMLLTSRYIVSPMKCLAEKVKNISTSNLEFKSEYESENEIGVLSRSFAEMTAKLSNAIISKEYLENIIDSVGDMFLVLDRKFNIIKVNRYTLDILAMDKEDIMGKPIETIFGDDFSRKNVTQRLDVEKTAQNIENIMIKADGSEMVVLSSFSTLYDDNGKKIGYACSSKDISSTKRDLSKLEEMNAQLLEKESDLIEKNKKDHLTGVFNRGHIYKLLKEVISGIPQKYDTVSIAMCDLDDFKCVNDCYGHQAGDRVIKAIAAIMRKNLRKGDYVGRYGGEEFLIVLPDASKEEAFEVIERIRKEIENANSIEGMQKVTLSSGISQHEDGRGREELIGIADDLLYKAKREGKNRICRTGQNGRHVNPNYTT